MNKHTKKIVSIILTLILLVSPFSINISTSAAAYSAISLNVPYFRQRASGMCSFSAFAMAEGYAVGCKNNDETVYQAVRKAHAPVKGETNSYIANPYANPPLVDGKRYIQIKHDLETIYSYLQAGKPVLIYRKGDGSHWAIIYGYNGSTTKLDQKGFLVLNDVLTSNVNYVQKETLSEFLTYGGSNVLADAVVRGTGVLSTANTAPATPSLTIDKSSVYLNNAVTVKWSSCGSNVTKYNIKVTLNNSEIASTSVTTCSYSYTPTTAGNYKITVIAVTNANLTSQSTVSFTATEEELPVSIKIQTMPEKIAYGKYETLDTKGLTICAVFKDGSTQVINSGFTCTPTSWDTIGNQEITVNYKGVTATFNVDVVCLHNKTEVTSIAPTCTQPGYNNAEICSDCGYIVVKGEEIPVADHSFGSWYITKYSTAESDGEMERKCENCGETQLENVKTEMEKPEEPLKGDMNGDGKITAADARLVLRVAAKLD